MTNTYCLDACALITIVKQEPGVETVRDLLRRASAGEITIYISAVNLSEVIYNFWPEKTPEQMETLWQFIRTMPITVIREITDRIINETARLKARNKMSHADALGLATAGGLDAIFVTSDHSEGYTDPMQEAFYYKISAPSPVHPIRVADRTRLGFDRTRHR